VFPKCAHSCTLKCAPSKAVSYSQHTLQLKNVNWKAQQRWGGDFKWAGVGWSSSFWFSWSSQLFLRDFPYAQTQSLCISVPETYFFDVILREGRDSEWLRAGRSGDRIPVGRPRFFAAVQTGPGAHPASYTKGTGSFTGVKRPGRGLDHPHLSSAEVKERAELYLYSTSGPSWPVRGWTVLRCCCCCCCCFYVRTIKTALTNTMPAEPTTL
jgi:hypothetical protein